jgi:hypothetical protein
VADDFGRFEADPSILASTTFPLRNGKLKLATVSGWLQELVIGEHVKTYASSGNIYGYFVNWKEHQGAPRAKESKFPEPPQASESICSQMQANAPVFVSESEDRIRVSDSWTVQADASADTAALSPPATGVGLNEETSPRKKSGKPRGHLAEFPEGWDVEPWMVALCEPKGLNAYHEFRDFKNHHMAKGTVFKSWPHAFRTWIANSVKFREQRRAG